MQKFNVLAFIFVFSVHGGYYTALSYDVSHDVFVSFTFANIEMVWFDTLISDQSLALLHILLINNVSNQTFGVRLKFETFISAKDKVTQRILT